MAFLVFDAPEAPGPFEDRLKIVEELVGAGRAPYARPHEHRVCGGVKDLKSELARVEALGGEGLMLRRPGSRYEVGRTASLLKVKSFYDAEALVVGHQAGAGRHKGRLGALLVQLADGTRFAVGTGFSDAERAAPPAIGETITFRYQELSDGGVPRFPSYVGVRADAKSAEVVVTYGRIGSAGQSKVKPAADAEAARRQADKLIAEKLREGYVEIRKGQAGQLASLPKRSEPTSR